MSDKLSKKRDLLKLPELETESQINVCNNFPPDFSYIMKKVACCVTRLNSLCATLIVLRAKYSASEMHIHPSAMFLYIDIIIIRWKEYRLPKLSSCNKLEFT